MKEKIGFILTMVLCMFIFACTANINYFTLDQEADGAGDGSGKIPANNVTIDLHGATFDTEKSQTSESKMPIALKGASASGGDQQEVENTYTPDNSEQTVNEGSTTVNNQEDGSDGDEDQDQDASGQNIQPSGDPIISQCFDHFDDGTSGYSGYMIFMQAYSDKEPFDSCFLNNKEMSKHDGLDNGRPFWKLKGHYDEAEIVCQRGKSLYKFTVRDGSKGDC